MHVCLKKADKPCIVAFDEFQQISKYPEKNIEALLRSHIQHLSNVHFIFSGSGCHLVTEMFLSSARPFYNSTSILELYPIVAEEYIPFVCHWFDVYERAIREEDVLVIYRLFEGNTYYMQKTFHEAFINIPIGSSCTLIYYGRQLMEFWKRQAMDIANYCPEFPNVRKNCCMP